jgi:hypothetical protein
LNHERANEQLRSCGFRSADSIKTNAEDEVEMKKNEDGRRAEKDQIVGSAIFGLQRKKSNLAPKST